MALKKEIVITGIGVVCPVGIGTDAFWTALCEGQSGVRRLELFDQSDLPVPFGAQVADFDPKQYVRPRKSLKVMSRDIQLGFAAADLACTEAGLRDHAPDPERLGVVFGADLMHCDLAEMAETDEIRQLFLGLAQEEAKHKLRFEIEYDENILTEN